MSDTMWSYVELMYFIARLIIELNFINIIIWFIVVCLGLDDSVFITHEKMAGIWYKWFVKCEGRIFAKSSF